MVSDNAKIYRDQFKDEKDVVKKTLRWVKASLTVINNNSSALTFYANLLYEDNDTTNAISTKIKALNSLPQNDDNTRGRLSLDSHTAGDRAFLWRLCL